MRLTIVPSDGFIAVDGKGYQGFDLSGMDPDIRAVQFDGGKGYVEYKSGPDARPPKEITSVEEFRPYINMFDARVAEIAAKAADPFYGLSPLEAAMAAAKIKIAELDTYHDSLKYANLQWRGHSYYVDKDAVEDFDKTMTRSAKLSPTDPIPTPYPITGSWVSADVDPITGQRILVPMTVEDLTDFTDDLYDRRGQLWVTRGSIAMTIESMVRQGATAQQIMDLDVTVGWI